MKQVNKAQKALLKVKFISKSESINKVINWKELTFDQLSDKIFSSFGLKQDKYYKLYYLDEQKEAITINNQNDFDVFIEILQYLVLYLEQTQEYFLHFHKNIKENYKHQKIKNIQIQEKEKVIQEMMKQYSIKIQNMKSEYQLQLNQQQIKFKKELNILQLKITNQKDDEIKQLRQKIESLLQQTKSNNRESNLSITEEIQMRKKQILIELKNYKKQLEQKTIKHTEQKLKQIFQQLQDKRKSNEIHSVKCSSNSCSKSQQIKGIRYYCIVCQINLCQQCEISGQHDSTNHPLFKIRDKAQTAELQKIIEFFPHKNQSNIKQLEIQRKIRYLQNELSISKQKAEKFVLEHPTLQQTQLVEQFLVKLL